MGVVEDVIGEKPMKVERLNTRRPTYASFCITADDSHRDALLNVNSWDEGVLVRPFFQTRAPTRDVNDDNDSANAYSSD